MKPGRARRKSNDFSDVPRGRARMTVVSSSTSSKMSIRSSGGRRSKGDSLWLRSVLVCMVSRIYVDTKTQPTSHRTCSLQYPYRRWLTCVDLM